jgi:formamidopyrimidine-DNA glycosylase
MPALPEVEVLRRDLEREVVCRWFKDAEIRPGSKSMKLVPRHGRRKEFHDLLEGARIDTVNRTATTLLLHLDSKHTLVFDLGPAALLTKTSASETLAPHTHIVFGFTIGGQLRLTDPLVSTEVFVAPTDEVLAVTGGGPSAIDPLSQGPLTWQHFSSLLDSRSDALKELLMDEKFVVGLGAIYSDEVLFAAGIRYDRPANRLSSQDVRRLYRGLLETLQDAVKARGTSYGPSAFHDLQGDPGSFQLEFKVFERQGEYCRRCRNLIEVAEWRSQPVYFCPQCQT